ncbi:excinuclease ABC subunit UvrC [Alkaliphilus serpentinus]|uniref:UvrABC system protein C n=1 Tax=Alkaliphilus serpentinus TaxID=1482731 RepID=A0A833HRM0_9FIRM|nr:excinuclease ABC subunit UvrC [Alkaliphilus serpentinus]KAB3533538.1 excinuclease ABC subunit UvrC [Alkaliphilus serpentinus]
MFDIQQNLKLLPDAPGVYLMKNKDDKVIYVGKAISLKNRVRQYFQSSKNHPSKVQAMVENINHFEYIVTDSELEALILECNLIKKYLPKYNVLLRDDKSYPYIKVTTSEDYPRVMKARGIKKDGNRYFGPYTSGGAFKETLEIIHRLYPIRTCSKNIERLITRKERPCLNYHIKKCIGPCTGGVTKEAYNHMIEEIIMLLSNKHNELKDKLEEKMKEAAKALNYEGAALYRDQLRALDHTLEKQKIITTNNVDQDVIAIEMGEEVAIIEVFIIREGKLIHRENFTIDIGHQEGRGEVLAAFIKQYYDNASFIPKEILVEEQLEEELVLEEWLSNKRSTKVSLRAPQRGDKRRLLEMVKKNAAISMEQRQKLENPVDHNLLLEELKELLDLDNLPDRIEAYDISNTTGLQSVGSMIVFQSGKPKNKDYRRFKIKTIEGPNDYGSLEEIIQRRFKRGMEETQLVIEGKLSINDGKFSVFPDLILVDGGFGQVSSVEKALRDLHVEIPVCGMIKDDKHKTRGLAYCGEEIILDKQSSLFRLIYKIQEEVHRFAISYHKTLRKNEMLKSDLDEIKGIGKARKIDLFHRFGSIANIKKASIHELMEVKGINQTIAEEIKQHLNKNDD